MKGKVLLISLLVFFLSAAPLYASTSRMIEIFYGVNDLRINGETVTPAERPFIYQGRTYVPLRFVSESLGSSVDWNPQNRRITIVDPNALQAGDAVVGRDVQPSNTAVGGRSGMRFDITARETVRDHTGKAHQASVQLLMQNFHENRSERWGLVEFPIQSVWKEFRADFALNQQYVGTRGEEHKLEIFLDDRRVQTITMKKGELSKPVRVSLGNAKKIGFRISSEEPSITYLGLYSPRFLR
ncbi:copper amine oxidase N-terminal domain-containing protein [Alkalicoccus chagannorensis]|uniref:copper amine oxidase N-terminal domain-containing protein n=1 Tax=Alkalicoccus chagannorensis TaxID=427072 RepID=UPI00040AE43F|nr:copper amine oxidase N-terminal domain-containing protein [Alkalicoccus chagannorensis]